MPERARQETLEMDSGTQQYENHLKHEYVLEKGGESAIITSTSCYWVGEETVWIISVLPERATGRQYLDALSGLGINEAQKIFDRLVGLGVLRLKAKRQFFRSLVSTLLNPRIKLLPSRLQQKFFELLHVNFPPGLIARTIKPLLVLSALGLGVGVFITLSGVSDTLAKSSVGRPNLGFVFVLILLGSLVHELGHSLAAAASGIGFRPIGLSVYLFYPVFYTNVSGMEKLPLWEKAAVDCGGFILQSAYLFFMLAAWFFTRNVSVLEAIRWISLIMAFNINPLLRTDGYWLYQDMRKSFGAKKLMAYLHYLYLAAFVAFSAYIFFRVFSGAGAITGSVKKIMLEPKLLLREGYQLILGCYFIIMAFVGGLHRLKESRNEWLELRKGQPQTVPEISRA